MQLYFFECGVLKSYKWLFVANGGDSNFDVPVPFFLIKHKGKNIMFDTGNNYKALTDKYGYWGKDLVDMVDPEFTEDQYSANAIKKVGVNPEDVDLVVLSHLHHDHAGAVGAFPNATYIVHRTEYNYAMRPDYFNRKSYIESEYHQNVDYYFLNGWQDNKFDLFNDGRIILYYTPGHSAGHQSMLVRTDKDGDFFMTADACYIVENLETLVLPGLSVDNPQYLQNLKTFNLLRKQGVRIVTGHDPEEWKKFKKAPEYYE
jgi:glyoxylase-like metal-dependent hydrolase (beta-lactamase superfamily II)